MNLRSHKSIMQLFGVYLEDPFSLYFLMELCREDSQTYTEKLPQEGTEIIKITFQKRPFGLRCDP